MTLKTQMAGDAQSVFLNDGEFAESVTYTPAGGPAKVLKAVVERKGLEPGEENVGRSLRRQAQVYLLDSATQGITSVDLQNDRVTLTDVEGNVQQARIQEVLGRDAGMWLLLVGW